MNKFTVLPSNNPLQMVLLETTHKKQGAFTFGNRCHALMVAGYLNNLCRRTIAFSPIPMMPPRTMGSVHFSECIICVGDIMNRLRYGHYVNYCVICHLNNWHGIVEQGPIPPKHLI